MKRRHSIPENDSTTVVRNALIVGAVVAISIGATVWLLRPRPPAVQSDTVRYLQLLRTGVSTHDPNAIEAVARAITKRRAEDPARHREWDYFDRIISLAQKGAWDQAEQVIVAWEESQSSRGLVLADAKH